MRAQPSGDLGGGPGVGDGRLDLRPVAHDAGVAEQPLDVPVGEAGNRLDAEAFERFPERRSLAQDHEPGQAGLEALEGQPLEHRVVVAYRAAPLVVVIAHIVGCGQRPWAAQATVRPGGSATHRSTSHVGAGMTARIYEPDSGGGCQELGWGVRGVARWVAGGDCSGWSPVCASSSESGASSASVGGCSAVTTSGGSGCGGFGCGGPGGAGGKGSGRIGGGAGAGGGSGSIGAGASGRGSTARRSAEIAAAAAAGDAAGAGAGVGAVAGTGPVEGVEVVEGTPGAAAGCISATRSASWAAAIAASTSLIR